MDGKPDLQALLAERGLTLAETERRAGLAKGSISRRLRGRRGWDVTLDWAMRVAHAAQAPLQEVADAIAVSLHRAEEEQRRRLSVEQARLEAELEG
jgi:transcriptional regulator with XRE-family HTH domain